MLTRGGSRGMQRSSSLTQRMAFAFAGVSDANGNQTSTRRPSRDQLATEARSAPSPPVASAGERCLLNDIGKLYLNEDHSDMVLIVEGIRVPALRSLLAIRNEYFRALLFGDLMESTQVAIELKETPLRPFKSILKYIYTGSLDFQGLDIETIVQMLALAQRFCFPKEVVESTIEKLISMINVENVLKMYEETKLLDHENLAKACVEFMDQNADEIIKDESFHRLASLETLKDILTRDTFCAEESEIFQSVHTWLKYNQGTGASEIDTEEVIGLVRLPLIVGLDKVLNDESSSHSFDGHWDLEYNLSYRLRALELPDINLISPVLNASLIEGESFNCKLSLHFGGQRRADREIKSILGWARHKDEKWITVKLGKRAKINHLKLLLPAKRASIFNSQDEPFWDSTLGIEFQPYVYTVQVSLDNQIWKTIISHNADPATDQPRAFHLVVPPIDWQIWYIKPIVAQYIRIKGQRKGGSRDARDSWFHVLSCECMLSSKPFTVNENSVLVPNFNVASLPHDLELNNIQNLFRTDCELVEKYRVYEQSFIAANIRRDMELLIVLQQPSLIDSMKFLLWDLDARTYSYFVKISPTGGESWTVIADCRYEECRSWQIVRFPLQVVKSIRIICTGVRHVASARQDFRVVHFECPACEEDKMIVGTPPNE